MKRLNIQRQKNLEPITIEFARNKLSELGYYCNVTDNKITFTYKGNIITLFPYSGWFSGKGVIAGRGIKELLNQLKTK